MVGRGPESCLWGIQSGQLGSMSNKQGPQGSCSEGDGGGVSLDISVACWGHSLYLDQHSTDRGLGWGLLVPGTRPGFWLAELTDPGCPGALSEATHPHRLLGSTPTHSRRVLLADPAQPRLAWDPNCAPASATPDGRPAVVVPGPPSTDLQVPVWKGD